jgi:hypothetical protein
VYTFFQKIDYCASKSADTAHRMLHMRLSLDLGVGKHPLMHRDRCKSANSSTVLDTSQGPVFMRMAAAAGMVAVDGVVRPQRPTSMTRRNCELCGSAAPCGCENRPQPTLHGNHDRILTAADLVLQSVDVHEAC